MLPILPATAQANNTPHEEKSIDSKSVKQELLVTVAESVSVVNGLPIGGHDKFVQASQLTRSQPKMSASTVGTMGLPQPIEPALILVVGKVVQGRPKRVEREQNRDEQQDTKKYSHGVRQVKVMFSGDQGDVTGSEKPEFASIICASLRHLRTT